MKQTAAQLNGMLREQDVIGRYGDLTYVVLIKNSDARVISGIEYRVNESIQKLSIKFDKLVEISTD